MNHLAHLALAGDSKAMIIGGFLGDFVKGRLEGRLIPELERGIRLHRAIDAFTDRHPQVVRAAGRFRPPFRRYSGILLDILFDHLLAQNWTDYYDCELEHYSRNVLNVLIENSELLPFRAQQLATAMHRTNSLANYGETRFLENAFAHLSTRLSRTNPIADAVSPCLELLPDIRADFRQFYPELQVFCHDWKTFR